MGAPTKNMIKMISTPLFYTILIGVFGMFDGPETWKYMNPVFGARRDVKQVSPGVNMRPVEDREFHAPLDDAAPLFSVAMLWDHHFRIGFAVKHLPIAARHQPAL